MNPVKPASLLTQSARSFVYVEKSSPASSHLIYLTYGVYELEGPAASGALSHAGEEALLFNLKGKVTVEIAGKVHELSRYDVLYVPRSTVYHLRQGEGQGRVVVCRAPATGDHPVYYASWEKLSRDETRIRHLKGKDVFLMFDVSEGADKLIAGFTLFEPRQRSWPPHNHTDQEEIYIFTKGSGAMAVYRDDESMSFVHSVREGDAVTIPFLNYHPVFSQEEELHFIWCIAGNRYWVGDKNKDFMAGKGDKLTT